MSRWICEREDRRSGSDSQGGGERGTTAAVCLKIIEAGRQMCFLNEVSLVPDVSDVAVTEAETHTQYGQSGPEGVLRIVVFLLLI